MYPTLQTHPGAVWTETPITADHGQLTSPNRRPVPVYYNRDSFQLGDEVTLENSGCRFDKNAPEMTTFVGSPANNYEMLSEYDGQIISRMYLPDSRFRIQHKNVVMVDCYTRIGWYVNRAVIQANLGMVSDVTNYDTRNLTIMHCTVDPYNAGANNTPDDARVCGMFFDSSNVYRCKVTKLSDAYAPDIHPSSGLGLTHANRIWSSYASTRYFFPNEGSTDGTHNDGIQLAGGDGDVFIGNTLINPTGGVEDPQFPGHTVIGQCIIMTAYHGLAGTAGGREPAQISNPYIKGNRLKGGYTQASFFPREDEGGGGTVGVTFVDNVHEGQCVWPIILTPVTSILATQVSGNVTGPTGLVWNNGTKTPGEAITPNIFANTTGLAGASVGSATAHAGNDQIVEGGQVVGLTGKGKTPSTTWNKGGTWSQVAGPTTLTITQGTASDGWNWGKVTVPQSATVQVYTMRFTSTNGASDTMTITVAPWQTGGI